MIEAFTLKSRGKDMVCLLEYKDPAARGKKVILYKHGFFGNKITPHRIMVNAGHELQEEGYTICRFDCVGAGDSEGDSHYTTIYGEIEDTKVVLHWIEEQVKPDKFMILGYSMGGIVTSVLCNEVPLDGILLWSPCSEPYAICWGRNYLKKDFREMMWTLWATWFPMSFLRGWTHRRLTLWPPYGILKSH